MRFIDGYFKHSRKIKQADLGMISELYISNILSPNDPDEYFVSDGNGSIQTFTYIEENSGELRSKGCLKYKLGNKKKKFKLVERSYDEAALLIDGRYLHVYEEASTEPTSYLIFAESTLQEKEVNYPEDDDEICLEFKTTGSEHHSDVVMSFLRLVEPHYHTRFLHFCVSNISTMYGQVLVTYANGSIKFHTLVSIIFLNLNELFLNIPSLPCLVDAPYFPHTNFTISYNWEEIYESKRYVFACEYPQKFILEVLTSILVEERMIFYSKKDSVLKVLEILSLLGPFRWPHILCLPLPIEMEEILESPLPFIVCIKRSIERDGVVIVDFDKLEVRFAKVHILPFEKEIGIEMRRNPREALRRYVNGIAREILLEREELIRKHGKTMLQNVIQDPTMFFRTKHTFYTSFFKTRMFLVFITEETSHSCRYLIELGKAPNVILLPYTLLTDKLKIRALKLWIELFDGEMDPVIEYLRTNRHLEDVANVVFRRLSYDKDYEKAWRVLSQIPHPTHEMYMNINIVSTMPRIQFGDLSGYTIYHLKACDCRALVLDDSAGEEDPFLQRRECLGETNLREGLRNVLSGNLTIGSSVNISDRIASLRSESNLTSYPHQYAQIRDRNRMSRRDVQQKIRTQLGGMRQSIFDLSKECCSCVDKTSLLLVDGPAYSFLCFLLTPENISLVLRYSLLENFLETNPQAYWSTVAYFSYFDLPLTWNTLNSEVDLIVEETSSFDFQLDGKPKFYFTP